RFGHKARGDYELLAALGRELGFATVHGEPVALPDGEVVSSTAVREAVARHDLSRAAAMLGRPFSVLGRVIEGQQLGRQLGFPTANIRVDHDSLLPFGIYAVRAEGVWGAASVGVRPTVERDGGQSVQPLLEVHLLDWSGSLYGRRMEVEFHHYVRPEWKFDSLDDLRAQIEQDCRDVREWAKANGAR
ncbi:MAG: riboflavin kinase, partial [Planctomycetota bacterium]